MNKQFLPQKHKKGHDIGVHFYQSFANVVCRLLNAAKVEMNTSFNQSLLTLFLPDNMYTHVVGK
jgi:hypothetical protein